MANNILSNTTHIFPDYTWPGTNSITDEMINDYMDSVKDFFINELNFYSYGGRESVASKNNTVFIDYFSATESGPPIFYFRNSTGSCRVTFFLGPCTYDNFNYRPLNTSYMTIVDPSQPAGNILSPISNNDPESIMLTFYSLYGDSPGMDHANVIIQDIKFQDGKRALFFKMKHKQSKEYILLGYRAVLFYTDIVYQNQLIKDWVFFTYKVNTSYNLEFNCHIANIDIKLDKDPFYLSNIEILEQMSGIIPGKYLGKEYLIKQNLYIGNEAYIPNIYRFSNLIGAETKKGLMGNIITIKNQDYLILYNGFRNNGQDAPSFQNKEYFNASETNTSGIDSYTDFLGNTLRKTDIINTESLLIPL